MKRAIGYAICAGILLLIPSPILWAVAVSWLALDILSELKKS